MVRRPSNRAEEAERRRRRCRASTNHHAAGKWTICWRSSKSRKRLSSLNILRSLNSLRSKQLMIRRGVEPALVLRRRFSRVGVGPEATEGCGALSADTSSARLDRGSLFRRTLETNEPFGRSRAVKYSGAGHGPEELAIYKEVIGSQTQSS